MQSHQPATADRMASLRGFEQVIEQAHRETVSPHFAVMVFLPVVGCGGCGKQPCFSLRRLRG